MPVIEHRPQSRLNPESLIFAPYAGDVASQGGEDGILAHLFTLIEPTRRFCVEFGAWDGKKFSNTWNLLNNLGWSGVMIEGSPERFEDLKATYADSPAGKVTLVNRFVSIDGEDRLDALLATAGAPVDFDLLSIDIDGNDWHVWRSLVDFRPKAVIIEFNPTIENDVYFVQDADPTINQGSSLLAMVELAKEKNYEFAAATGANAIFVEASLFAQLGIKDNGIDSLFQPKYQTKLFHGFDGTFFAAGYLGIMWHHAALTQEDYQILPKHMRVFKGV